MKIKNFWKNIFQPTKIYFLFVFSSKKVENNAFGDEEGKNHINLFWFFSTFSHFTKNVCSIYIQHFLFLEIDTIFLFQKKCNKKNLIGVNEKEKGGQLHFNQKEEKKNNF